MIEINEKNNYKNKLAELGIHSSIELLRKENREKILKALSNSEIKRLLGEKQLRAREMSLNHRILLSNALGFSFNTELINFIKDAPVEKLAAVRDKKAGKNYLIPYLLGNKENLNQISFIETGKSLNELLINDIKKRYSSIMHTSGTINDFQKTKQGKIAMSYLCNVHVTKKNKAKYNKELTNVILRKNTINKIHDKLYSLKINSGLDLVKQSNDFWVNKIGMNEVRKYLGYSINISHFRQKEKMHIAKKLGFNISKEIALKIIESNDPIQAIIDCKLGKYIVTYIINMLPNIERVFFTKKNISLELYLRNFIIEKGINITPRACRKTYYLLLISIILRKKIAYNDKNLSQNIGILQQLISNTRSDIQSRGLQQP